MEELRCGSGLGLKIGRLMSDGATYRAIGAIGALKTEGNALHRRQSMMWWMWGTCPEGELLMMSEIEVDEVEVEVGN